VTGCDFGAQESVGFDLGQPLQQPPALLAPGGLDGDSASLQSGGVGQKAGEFVQKDLAVARAWGQRGWADQSGVSRRLTCLSETDVQRIAAVLEQVSQPLLDQEVVCALGEGCLELDGDLSPRPVSNTSQTYRDASYGHLLAKQCQSARERASQSRRALTSQRRVARPGLLVKI
jgi:hypothetical protein